MLHTLIGSASCVSYSQLHLGGNGIGPEGAKSLAEALRVNGSLTKIGEGGLDLENNSIREEGWAAIIGAVCSSTVSKISTIDASSKGIGSAGAKLIAQSLKTSVNASLTQVHALCQHPLTHQPEHPLLRCIR